MRGFIRFAISFLLTACLLALVPARASMPQTGPENSRKIHGVWYPHKTEQQLPGTGWKLEVFDTDVVVTYTRSNGAKVGDIDVVMYRVPYRVEEAGRDRKLVPAKEDLGLSVLTCRLEGDRLLVAEGTCGEKISLRGEWRRTPLRD